MTCRWRAVPKSFKANNDRMAQAAGTMADPGKPLRARIPSKSAATRSGRKRNRPPNLVWRARGARSSWRTSATSAVTGRGWSGRSSSRRRGSLAKPSSLRIAATAAGLSDSPSRAKARLMSWTERFCFRRVTTCSRSRCCLPGGRPSRAVGAKKSRPGLIAELMDKDAKAPGCIAEAGGCLGGGETVDEEGPEGFVLPMGGVGGLQEPACQC